MSQYLLKHKNITLTAQPSAAVSACGYNCLSKEFLVIYQGEPEVVYVYEQVTLEEAADFECAESKGRFVNQVIKRHPYHKEILGESP